MEKPSRREPSRQEPYRQSFGSGGEDIARRFLGQKGYRPLASRFSSRWGEIDLVMEDRGCVVFVEVKRRRSDRYGSPEEAVAAVKKSHLARAAILFVQRHRLENRPVRFDVVAIDEEGIRHHENAFTVEPDFYY